MRLFLCILALLSLSCVATAEPPKCASGCLAPAACPPSCASCPSGCFVAVPAQAVVMPPGIPAGRWEWTRHGFIGSGRWGWVWVPSEVRVTYGGRR